MLVNKSLIAGILVFALIASFGFALVFYNLAGAESNQGKGSDDGVDDIDKVNIENLPASMGKFQLKGVITAVNASGSQVSVNGLAINVAVNAKIRKGDLRAFADLAVDDRVEVSGKVENGIITADKIRVKGIKQILILPAAGGAVSGEVSKLRNDLQGRIAEILKRIQELQDRINKKLGPSAPPAGSTTTPSSGGAATSTP